MLIGFTNQFFSKFKKFFFVKDGTSLVTHFLSVCVCFCMCVCVFVFFTYVCMCFCICAFACVCMCFCVCVHKICEWTKFSSCFCFLQKIFSSWNNATFNESKQRMSFSFSILIYSAKLFNLFFFFFLQKAKCHFIYYFCFFEEWILFSHFFLCRSISQLRICHRNWISNKNWTFFCHEKKSRKWEYLLVLKWLIW